MAYISKIQLKGENDAAVLYDIRDAEAISVTKNIIYVTNFGATGDGVTDDTESIQNCINNNPHTTIIFPKGNYKIMAPLEIYEDNDSQVDLYFESGSRLFAGSVINALIEIGKVKENVTSHWTRYKLGDIVTISGSGILDATNCDKQYI
jgi:polygalacturonase